MDNGQLQLRRYGTFEKRKTSDKKGTQCHDEVSEYYSSLRNSDEDYRCRYHN